MIAHCLDSKLYKKTMKENQEPTIAATSTTEAFMPEQPAGHGGNRGSNWDVLEMQTEPGTDLEEAMKKSTDRHLRLSFDDSTLRCTMKVFFADQFAALRRNCDCEELFIESLARCVKWDAIGGKSGSTFLKTKGEIWSSASMPGAPSCSKSCSEHFHQTIASSSRRSRPPR